MQNEQANVAENQTENALSWGSLFLRVFGGYILVSIVSQIFNPFPTGNGWTPADKIIISALMYLIQYFSIFIVFSIIALSIARIPSRNRSKALPPFFNGALIGTLVVSGVLIYGGWYGAKRATEIASTNQTTPRIVASPERAKVTAAITIQDGEGVTSGDFDQEMLEYLESWLVQTVLKKGKSRFADMGNDPDKFSPRIIANSVYIIVHDKKLAVIKINMADAVRSVAIIGVEGKEVIRVTCIRNSNHDIALFSGECGDKIKEAFGVSIRP